MIARRLRETTRPVLAAILFAACGGKELDLGHDLRPRNRDYATPETIAAEADAGPGVPTIIAQHQYSASAVSVDNTRIYWLTEFTGWSNGGFVRSCTKTDCAGTLITYVDESFPSHVAIRRTVVNSTHLFWSGSIDSTLTSAVAACPISGCAPRPIEIFPNDNARRLLDFVVDDTQFFALIQAGTTTIVECPVTGCQHNPTLMATLTQVPDPPSSYAFAADTGNLYWIEGVGSSRTAGQIMTMPKDGATSPRVLAPAGHLVGALATFGPNLYWSESHVSAAVKTCEVSNCEATTKNIATAQPYPQHLAVHGNTAGWFASLDSGIDRALGDLVAWPLDLTAPMPTVFATSAQSPTSLAIDDTHLYLTTNDEWGGTLQPFPEGGGAVKRVRRPQ